MMRKMEKKVNEDGKDGEEKRNDWIKDGESERK